MDFAQLFRNQHTSVPRIGKLSVIVWGENEHERRNPAVAKHYPEGMHEAVAAGLRESCDDFEVTTAVLQDPEHGLTKERLNRTDVLVWWGHMEHDLVADEVVERVQRRVLEGMGLVVQHSGTTRRSSSG